MRALRSQHTKGSVVDKLDVLTTENSELKNEVESLKKALNEAQASTGIDANDLSSLTLKHQKEIDGLKKKNLELKEKVLNLEAENSKNTELKKVISNLESKNKELQEKLTNSNPEELNLKEELESKSSEINELHKKIQELKSSGHTDSEMISGNELSRIRLDFTDKQKTIFNFLFETYQDNQKEWLPFANSEYSLIEEVSMKPSEITSFKKKLVKYGLAKIELKPNEETKRDTTFYKFLVNDRL